MAARIDRIAHEATAESRGLIRTSGLVAAGVATGTISRRVAAGVWARPHHGVVDVTRQEWDWGRRLLAAVLANPPGTVASHTSAAALHRLPGFPRSGRIEITTPRAGRTSAVPYVIHSTLRPIADDLVIDAVPCADPVRTLVGLATCTDDRALARATREALRRGLITSEAVESEALDLLPGTGRLRRCVTREFAATLLAVESPIEDEVVARLLVVPGLPTFTTQFEVQVRGRRLRPDIAWTEHRVILEVDGSRWHADHLAAAADTERQRLLEGAGWVVLRVSTADLESDVAWSRFLGRLRLALSF